MLVSFLRAYVDILYICTITHCHVNIDCDTVSQASLFHNMYNSSVKVVVNYEAIIDLM